MNKHLFVSGMILILFMSIISNYIENNASEKDFTGKIVGVWEFEQLGVMLNYHFYENGNFEIIFLFDGNEFIPILGEYVITSDNISMRYPLNDPSDDPPPIVFNYTFFDNDTILELVDVIYKEKIVFIRIE